MKQMLLSEGSRLGHYEILEPIGAGGMGEVYRARDPRVGREVAVKISAEHFSERFDREGTSDRSAEPSKYLYASRRRAELSGEQKISQQLILIQNWTAAIRK